MYFHILINPQIMIDINTFEKLANDIIANSTKDEMQNWLEMYTDNIPTLFLNMQ